MPPFDGGAVGFVGHEFIHTVEPSIAISENDPLKLPILYYIITDSVLIFDHVKQVLKICVYAEINDSTEEAYHQAVTEINRIHTTYFKSPLKLTISKLRNPTKYLFQKAISNLRNSKHP